MAEKQKIQTRKINKSSVDGVNSLQFPHCVSLGVWLESESKLLGKIIVSLEFSCPQDYSPLWLVSPASFISLSLRPTNHQNVFQSRMGEEEAGVSFNFRVLGMKLMPKGQLSPHCPS